MHTHTHLPSCLPISAHQLRHSFEDLYAEAVRILAGRPTLPLAGLAASAAASYGPPPAADPASVLARLSGASSASEGDGSTGRAPGYRPSAASIASSSAAGPASYPLPLQRLLSGATSCCLDDTAAAALGTPGACQTGRPASPCWLATATAAALWALAALHGLLAALLRAELALAQRCTSGLVRRLGE